MGSTVELSLGARRLWLLQRNRRYRELDAAKARKRIVVAEAEFEGRCGQAAGLAQARPPIEDQLDFIDEEVCDGWRRSSRSADLVSGGGPWHGLGMSTPSLTSPQPLHRAVSHRTVVVVGLIVAIALAVTLLAVTAHPTARSSAPLLRPPLTPAALAYQADTAHRYATSAEAGARLDHRGLKSAVARPVAAGSTEMSRGMGHQ